MDSSDLTETLQDAGLSPYQAEAYVAVLELGASSATDIAEASSVPDPRIYDVLRDLEDKGYVETYQQDSLHARAHDPAEVLQDLQTLAERFSDAAEEIEERWNRPAIDDHKVSIVTRFETVIERAESRIESADNQVQLSVPANRYERLAPALRTAREAGVDVKLSLYAPAGDATALPDESELETTCTEARHRQLPSPFVALVDRAWTCFSPHASSVNEYGILVDDRTHTYVFHWFFLTCLWEQWDSLYVEGRTDPPITYVEIRQCVRDVGPLVDDGVTVRATVDGYDTETGERVELSGNIVETGYASASASDRDERLPSQLAGQVQLTIHTGTETYTVGGWGAMIESVEAERITITAIE
ncbi:TrmB family transcriptional regulator sugar-binding domain-containing protein [Halostella sp. PRR32]|uniref:TrmB family transcriptional regulator n=1 Tax=Halostella sp. PRR32 TaxID=3098147 RepID=UPI002B1D0D79|nr:TrmB family transcriptional regulator sugar-binding domain-containing protein [Halostella sp. PRR32]